MRNYYLITEKTPNWFHRCVHMIDHHHLSPCAPSVLLFIKSSSKTNRQTNHQAGITFCFRSEIQDFFFLILCGFSYLNKEPLLLTAHSWQVFLVQDRLYMNPCVSVCVCVLRFQNSPGLLLDLSCLLICGRTYFLIQVYILWHHCFSLV